MTQAVLQSVHLWADDSPVRVAGIVDVERTETGATLSRLPRWARAQIMDPTVLPIAAMPVGGRLEFTTNATAIELELHLTHLRFGEAPVRKKAVDLVVDDALTTAETTTEGHVLHFPTINSSDISSFEFHPGGPATFRFDGLDQGEKRIELWLPHNALVELRDLRVPAGATVSASRGARRRWVHYGSSISHCTEMDRPTDVWPVAVARRAGVDLTSLALSGQCHLDQFVARTIRDLPVDLVSLKPGANILGADSMRQRAFVSAVHGFLDTVRDGHPAVPIIVATPVVCPMFEDHPGPHAIGPDGIWHAVDRPDSLAVDALTGSRGRELLEVAVMARQAAGDRNLHFVNGLDLFGVDDAPDLPDGLHPSIEGYRRIGQRFYDLAFGPGRPFA
jgi:GDSL-like Lipase/Acylhydrolase family